MREQAGFQRGRMDGGQPRPVPAGLTQGVFACLLFLFPSSAHLGVLVVPRIFQVFEDDTWSCSVSSVLEEREVIFQRVMALLQPGIEVA